MRLAFSFWSWLCQSVVTRCVTMGTWFNLFGPVFSSVNPRGLDKVVSRDFFLISTVIWFLKKIYLLFIWLCRVLVAARGIFVATCRIFVVVCGIFSCGMRDLVPWPGMEPRPPALGVRSLNCWTTREVPPVIWFVFVSFPNGILRISSLWFNALVPDWFT